MLLHDISHNKNSGLNSFYICKRNNCLAFGIYSLGSLLVHISVLTEDSKVAQIYNASRIWPFSFCESALIMTLSRHYFKLECN